MRNIATKVTGSSLTADEFNDIPTELENAITDTGIALTGSDLFQLSKSISNYVAGGSFYTDSGTSTQYTLNLIGSKQSPTEYFDGLSVSFVAGANNTTATPTINVAGLGVKNIVVSTGVPLELDDISTSGVTTLYYDGTEFTYPGVFAARGTQVYENEAALVADTGLSAGRLVSTKGKLTEDDGGGADYIVQTSSGTDHRFVNLDNGLQAREINPRQVDLSKQNKGYLLAELDISSLGLSPERFAQGMMFNSRANKIYLYQRVAGSTDKNDERQQIVEFDLGAEGATLVPVDNTPDLTSGHQGMGIEHRSDTDPTSIYLWTKAAPHLADTASNEQTGKHVFRWDYKGSSTTNGDATRYELFPDEGSALPLEEFFNLTPTISTCQNFLLGKVSAFGVEGSDQRMFIWDLNVVNGLSGAQIMDPANFNRSSAAYITDWALSREQLRTNNFTQAVSCDGKFVYITCGGPSLTPGEKDNVVYTMSGVLVDRYDHTMGDPAVDPSPPAGTATDWEPEGGALWASGTHQLLTLINTKFDDTGTDRVSTQVWGLRKDDYQSINQTQSQFVELGSDTHYDGGIPREITFNTGNTLEIGSIDKTTGVYVKGFVFQDDGTIEFHQPLDPSNGSRVTRGSGASREILELRGNTGLGDGAAINLYGDADSTEPNNVIIFINGLAQMSITADGRVVIEGDGFLKLKNANGESNIIRSTATDREILEIRGNTSTSNGGAINVYGTDDNTNPGNVRLQPESGSFLDFQNLPTIDPGGSNRVWNNSGVLNIT